MPGKSTKRGAEKNQNDSKCEPGVPKRKRNQNKPKCGLCDRKRRKLKKTECCDNWICDDEHTYVPFSFSFISCRRNHRRYTMCGFHFSQEDHEGYWKNCKICQEDLDSFVAYGSNEYNFEPLKKDEIEALENSEKILLEDPNKEVLEDPKKKVLKDPVKEVLEDSVKEVVENPVKEVLKNPVKEVLEDTEKFSILCVNCGTTVETLDDFHLNTSKGYYCTSEECQKVGLAN